MKQLSRKASQFFLNIILILVLFITILFISLGIFFSDYKEKSIEEMKTNYNLNIMYYTKKLKDAILLLDKRAIDNFYLEVIKTPYIRDFSIQDSKYIFDKNSLLFHTLNFSDDSWTLLDVQTDIYNGEIIKIQGTGFFEFLPSKDFNINDKLIVRYQLLKNDVIKNFVVAIDLNLFYVNQVKENREISSYPFWFRLFYNEEFNQKIVVNEKIADIYSFDLIYTIDDTFLKQKLYEILLDIFSLIIIIFLLFIVVMIPFLKYLENKYIKKPMNYLNGLLEETLEYKFTNIEEKKFNNIPDFDKVIKNFRKISYNMANLKNELNINRELVERNILVDNLTGLFDKKMFDLDMKEMFVSSSSGYILYFKISKLNEISILNGSSITDDFLISFVNCVNDTLHDFKKTESKFYRFHGSEFVIIAKNFLYEEIVDLSEKIIKNLWLELPKNYLLPENIFHIGGAPFDIYGTTDSILKMTNRALVNSEAKKENSFSIIHENDINEERIILENRVRNIVSNVDFSFDFVLDSFSFDENRLLMREMKPILLDDERNQLPIGVFIAACEKLKLNIDFDKQVIIKAIEFIKNKNPEYKIAINLSIKTISSENFIEFISKLVAEQKIYMDKLLFSLTSYTASAYNKEFKKFVEKLNELNIEILIKRYKPKDYSIEDLAILGINYIRIDKDLTQNVYQDLMKKHKIKNILVYAQLNNIKVLTDNIESKKDFELLSKLELYARSK